MAQLIYAALILFGLGVSIAVVGMIVIRSKVRMPGALRVLQTAFITVCVIVAGGSLLIGVQGLSESQGHYW